MIAERSPEGSHQANVDHFEAILLDRRQSMLNGEIQDIDEALNLIREGSFGICDGCGKGISRECLDAIPYARLCLPCEMDEEAL